MIISYTRWNKIHFLFVLPFNRKKLNSTICYCCWETKREIHFFCFVSKSIYLSYTRWLVDYHIHSSLVMTHELNHKSWFILWIERAKKINIQSKMKANIRHRNITYWLFCGTFDNFIRLFFFSSFLFYHTLWGLRLIYYYTGCCTSDFVWLINQFITFTCSVYIKASILLVSNFLTQNLLFFVFCFRFFFLFFLSIVMHVGWARGYNQKGKKIKE